MGAWHEACDSSAPKPVRKVPSDFEIPNHQQYIIMKLTSSIGAGLIAIALTTAAQAAFISGNVNFLGGAVLQDSGGATTTTLSSAAGVKSWVAPRVLDGSGSFSGLVANTPVTFTAPWVFNPSTAVTPLWSVGGFTFNLASSFIAVQTAGFLSIGGTGTVSGPGFEATPGTWFFSTQGTASDDQTFSWSSSTGANASRVPDGGKTLALLGTALLGLQGMRRKLRLL